MTTLQAAFLILLLAIWLCISVVFLITVIQNLLNDRKEEQRRVEADKRDKEYHEKRMKELDRAK